MMSESNSTAMCPMANACKGMMNKPMAGPVLVIPALVFVILGVAVLIEPRILAWIAGIALIVMGIAMLVFGGFMRRLAERS